MTTIRLPDVPAINYARNQSHNGPPFEKDFCLGACSLAFVGHASGKDTAVLGWEASGGKHRPLKSQTVREFLATVPRGFPLWFSGGGSGDGHVVITGVVGTCWSTDIKRIGFFSHVPIEDILTWNKVNPLKILGWSTDLCGFPLGYKPHSKDAIKV